MTFWTYQAPLFLLFIILFIINNLGGLTTCQSISPTALPSESSLKPGEVRVLSLQKRGVPSNESYARLLSPFPELFDFTVCYRIRLKRYREESTLMSYAVSEEKDNELRMDHRITGYKVSLHSTWATAKVTSQLRYWEHFCFQFGYTSKKWTIFRNGASAANGSFTFDTLGPLEGKGTYIIGQEQDRMGGGFQRDQSYSGEISELNFWSRVLDPRTIKQMADCKIKEEGDALSWTSQVWQIHGDVSWVTYSKEDEICQMSTRELIVFPDRFSKAPALHLCHILGGILAVPKTEAESDSLFESMKDSARYCSGGTGSSFLWLGANDIDTEGKWRYWGTQKEISWPGKWRGGGPNGGIEENCMVMLFGSFPGLWSDIACLSTYEFCVPCEFQELKVLYLKGPAVCEGSPFNLQYLLSTDRGGRPSLEGFFHSDIFWDTEEEVWVMQSLKEAATAWWKPPGEVMYPFGTHAWTLDSKVCNKLVNETVNLTISLCGSGQFTCTDGTCIDLMQRCDLRVNCPDQSDEAQCTLLDIPPGYMPAIPPPPTTENEPLPIKLSINIISFPTIATEDMTFIASMQLRLRWKDTRLEYLNLKNDRSLNVLSQSAVKDIWKPRVFFSNAQGNVFTNLKEGSRIECIRSGKSKPGAAYFSKEVNTFSGSENSLEMSQLYSVTYTCDFDLIMFPFDAQVCHLRFTIVSATISYMKLVPGNATYLGPKNLIEYSIGKVTIKTDADGEFSSLDIGVRFRRRYGFYMLTLYIPTTLIIITAYTTFYFNIFDFNSRIVVALTSLLVLSSLYTQTSNSLPKTSYFKLVDIWLFFSIVMIFMVVLLQTLIDFSAQAEFDGNSWISRIMAKIFQQETKQVKIKPSNTKIGDQTTWVTSLTRCLKPNAKVENVAIQVVEFKDVENNTSTQVRQRWSHSRNSSSHNDPEYMSLQNGTGVNRFSPKANKSLMVKGRMLVPGIFMIFNAAYWGTAVNYLNSLDSNDE